MLSSPGIGGTAGDPPVAITILRVRISRPLTATVHGDVIFASPSKSRVRNLQSIGRGLRKSDDKTSVKLYDISDDLGRNNFTLKHFKERINIYNEEIFDYKIIQINLTGK